MISSGGCARAAEAYFVIKQTKNYINNEINIILKKTTSSYGHSTRK